ncbi:MAG: PHP domain-containing protein [Clostridium sp.]|nr:PHP domain-containing protein [Clostridium sp.]
MENIEKFPILLDIHTHCISSGHGSHDTITDMARAAAGRSLKVLGISDHGPKTAGAGSSSYFRNLLLAERRRFGVSLLYGVELNILNEKGDVDLEDSLIASLDYAFISMHHPVFKAGDTAFNTNAYINAMKHPGVRFLGHPDDGRFPADYERLLSACAKYRVYPEINNASLTPDAYRTDGHKNSMEILSICKKRRLPVLLSSDSHGKGHVGDMEYIFPLLEECDFPPELVINGSVELLTGLLAK